MNIFLKMLGIFNFFLINFMFIKSLVLNVTNRDMQKFVHE